MPADTTTLVIFGASGDLTRNKLIPALFGLWRKERLPAGFRLVGMSRSVPPTEAFCAEIRQAAVDGSDGDRSLLGSIRQPHRDAAGGSNDRPKLCPASAPI